MKTCKLSITTVADGVESSLTRQGNMKLSLTGAELYYREENALVYMQFENSTATFKREGDYTLELHLQEGKETEGSIGIGGSNGRILTVAHRVAYSVSKDSLLVSLHYDLIVSGEKQEMKLRLLSRFEEDHV